MKVICFFIENRENNQDSAFSFSDYRIVSVRYDNFVEQKLLISLPVALLNRIKYTIIHPWEKNRINIVKNIENELLVKLVSKNSLIGNFDIFNT